MPATTTQQTFSNELVCTEMPSMTLPGTVRVLLDAHLKERRTTQRLRIPDELIDDVLLATSELVNNACEATPYAAITFKGILERQAIWIGVWDSSREEPRPRRVLVEVDDIAPDANCLNEGYEPSDIGGWGIPIVMTLCPAEDRDITWTNNPSGKWVWARFRF